MAHFHVITCRGIGEKLGSSDNMLTGVTDRLPIDTNWHYHELPWVSEYGPGGGNIFGDSYVENIHAGMIMLQDLIQDIIEENDSGDLPQIIILGYSAGATLAGNYALGASTIPNIASYIAAVGLVSDPMRPRGGGTALYTAPDFGVGGERDIPSHSFPVFWISDPMDPITSTPENSPLRTIADQSWAMSFAPGKFPAWMGDLVDRLKTGRWQKVAIHWWDPVSVIRQYADAIAGANRYLFGGDHTSYGVRNVPNTDVNYLQHLANRIAGAVGS